MGIKSGTPRIKRVHAKNYISKQADARLKEAVRPYQEMGKQALGVDSFEVKYYQQTKSTTICTCKQTTLFQHHASVVEPSRNVPVTLAKNDSIIEETVSIDYDRPLFGFHSERELQDEPTTLGDEFDFVDEEDGSSGGQPATLDNLFAAGTDCGICYKTGFVPGYSAYGFERHVLATHNIADVYGYHMDVTSAPHKMRRLDMREGYVDFEVDVPRYFKDVNVSVRNNTDILPDTLYTILGQDDRLTFNEVKLNAGKKMVVRVLAAEFTHVVIEFDLGTEKLLANLAQMTKTVDWTLFDTLGNINIILPMTISSVNANDVIYVPKRQALFKITDVTYLRTADERNLDWSVNTRVLQPQEALGRISKSFKLF